MTTLSGEMYDAFKEAGATDNTSRKAAEAIAKIEADLMILKWIAGANFAAVIAILVRVYVP